MIIRPMLVAGRLSLVESDGPLDWTLYEGRGYAAFPCSDMDELNGTPAIVDCPHLAVEFNPSRLFAAIAVHRPYLTRLPRAHTCLTHADVDGTPLTSIMYAKYLLARRKAHEILLRSSEVTEVFLDPYKAPCDCKVLNALASEAVCRLGYPQVRLQLLSGPAPSDALQVIENNTIDRASDYLHIFLRERLQAGLAARALPSDWIERFSAYSRALCYVDVIDEVEQATGIATPQPDGEGTN